MTTARTPILYAALDAGPGGHARLTREVVSLEVDEHLGRATKIRLVLARRPALERATSQLVEGAALVVRWRVGGDLSAPVGGIIHRIEPRYADGTLSVEAMGRELSLSRGAVRRAFTGRTLREAVEDLARDAGITVRWEAGAGVRFDGQVIADEHAWGWIQRRTAELGLEALLENGVLIVREPPTGLAPVAVLRWNRRDANVLQFDPETHTQRRRRDDEGVVAVLVDPATGEELRHAAGDPTATRRTLARRRVEAEARQRAAGAAQTAPAASTSAAPSSPVAPSPTPAGETLLPGGGVDLGADLDVLVVDTPPTLSTSDADGAEARTVPVTAATDAASARAHATAIANGRFRARDLSRVKARATVIGEPRLRRGTVVKLVGVEERDAGLWYVRAAVHRLERGYTTELELSREGVNGRTGRRAAPAATPNTEAAASSSSPSSGATPAAPTRTVDLDTGVVS